MRKTQLIRMFALDAIADDYEDRNTVASHAVALGHRCGLSIDPAEIEIALSALIDLGLAMAYVLTPLGPPRSLSNMPEGMRPESEIGWYYFYATPTGREVQMADWDGWPFDDKGKLRSDWSRSEFSEESN
jgi:hypothetical protein